MTVQEKKIEHIRYLLEAMTGTLNNSEESVEKMFKISKKEALYNVSFALLKAIGKLK